MNQEQLVAIMAAIVWSGPDAPSSKTQAVQDAIDLLSLAQTQLLMSLRKAKGKQ